MPNSEDFDIDALKKTWKDQVISDGYNQDEIEVMLNKKSRNYVKYILWISIIEFILILVRLIIFQYFLSCRCLVRLLVNV